MKRTLITVLCCLAIGASAWGQEDVDEARLADSSGGSGGYPGETFYIEPCDTKVVGFTTCDDQSGDGSPNSPFVTWENALQALEPGDTLLAKNGTYDSDDGPFIAQCGVYGLTGARCTSVDYECGAAGAPITVKAENEREAILTSFDNQDDGTIILAGCCHWHIGGFQAKGEQIDGENVAIVQVSNSSDIEIKGMVVSDTSLIADWNLPGISLFGVEGALVEGNEVYNFEERGIEVSHGTDITLRRNFISQNDYGDYAGGGMSLYPAKNVIVENNVIYDSGFGVDIVEHASTVVGSMANIKILGNVFWKNTSGDLRIDVREDGIAGLEVRDNLFLETSGQPAIDTDGIDIDVTNDTSLWVHRNNFIGAAVMAVRAKDCLIGTCSIDGYCDGRPLCQDDDCAGVGDCHTHAFGPGSTADGVLFLSNLVIDGGVLVPTAEFGNIGTCTHGDNQIYNQDGGINDTNSGCTESPTNWSTNPNFGEPNDETVQLNATVGCKAIVPGGNSALGRRGIGISTIYKYVDGVSVAANGKLWTSSGFPCGAQVSGMTAPAVRCSTIHTDLNFGTGTDECKYP